MASLIYNGIKKNLPRWDVKIVCALHLLRKYQVGNESSILCKVLLGVLENLISIWFLKVVQYIKFAPAGRLRLGQHDT